MVDMDRIPSEDEIKWSLFEQSLKDFPLPSIPDAVDLKVMDPAISILNMMRRAPNEDGRILFGTHEYDTATAIKSFREFCDKYHVSLDELELIAALERMEMENNRLSKNIMQQAVLMVGAGAGADGVVQHLSCKEHSWRGKGVLSKAEDQGLSPICWLIGAGEVLEAVYLIEHKELVQLSKQQLLDGCASKTLAYDSPLHCLFDWIKSNGLVSASKYPWTGKKASLKKMEPEFTLEGYETVSDCDEDDIKRRLYERPLCIVIHASSQLVALKKGKIYHVTKQEYDPFVASCKRLGRPIMCHCVLLTGWNEIGGVPVWEALNSYGDKYCDDGYFYFVRGSAINEDLEYNPLLQVLDVKGFKKAAK